MAHKNYSLVLFSSVVQWNEVYVNTHTHMLTHIPRYVWMCLFCCCSVAKSCLTLRDPVDCSMPSFPVLHHPSELAQIHVRWVSDAISSSATLFFGLQSFPESGSFPTHWPFTPRGQSTESFSFIISIYLNLYLNPSLCKMHGCWEIWLSVFCVYVSFILFLEDP